MCKVTLNLSQYDDRSYYFRRANKLELTLPLNKSDILASFKSLGVTPEVIQGLEALGIVKPTEIQVQSIPKLIKSPIDFIGMAQTGTGKTAAYSIPIIQNIDPNEPKIQALILCPTRELGQQIAKQIFKFMKLSTRKFNTLSSLKMCCYVFDNVLLCIR